MDAKSEGNLREKLGKALENGDQYEIAKALNEEDVFHLANSAEKAMRVIKDKDSVNLIRTLQDKIRASGYDEKVEQEANKEVINKLSVEDFYRYLRNKHAFDRLRSVGLWSKDIGEKLAEYFGVSSIEFQQTKDGWKSVE